MADYIITCPSRSCAAPLRLPAEGIGQPLSCPHCRTAIRVELGPDAQIARVSAIGSAWGLPRMLLVPGFALLILGAAGVFTNSYIAIRSVREDDFALRYARSRVGDLRNSEFLTAPAREQKPNREALPQDAFAAVAGQLARIAQQEDADEKLAENWAPYVPGLHGVFAIVSLIVAVGGTCLIRGRFYWIAMLGSVVAIFNINLMCCVPGAVAGIWGILTLARDEGRKHFGLKPTL
jgi:hypothetical protein